MVIKKSLSECVSLNVPYCRMENVNNGFVVNFHRREQFSFTGLCPRPHQHSGENNSHLVPGDRAMQLPAPKIKMKAVILFREM